MRRRSILLSLLVIATVATIIGIGSWAVFNDTEDAGTFTAQAGTIDLELDTTQVVQAGLTDLKPSQWRYLGPFILHNAGSNPGVLDLHFNNIVDDGGEMSEPETEADPSGTINDISNHIDVDWCIDGDVNGYRGCDGKVLGKLGNIESQTFNLDTLNHSDRVELWLSFHLANVGNEYQGDKTDFDIELTLHQIAIPASATVVNLENKDASWQPILGDGIEGLVTYWTGSDLHMLLQAQGLTPGEWYQIGLTGPDTCSTTDDQLASGTQQYPDFDSHFWVSGAPSATCTTTGYGFFNFDYVQADASGAINKAYTIHDAGVGDPAGSTDVTGTHPSLPQGTYTGVKFLIKDYVPNSMPPTWPGTFTGVLMEMNTLDFNLP